MPKAFQFRLEKILDLRRLHEDLRKRDFAAARKEVVEQQQKILQLLLEEDRTKRALRDLKTRELDLQMIRLQEQYLNSLGRRIVADYRTLQKKQKTENEKRRELAEASKGVRVLERLRERKEGEYRIELDRIEQKFLDEVAQNMSRGER